MTADKVGRRERRGGRGEKKRRSAMMELLLLVVVWPGRGGGEGRVVDVVQQKLHGCYIGRCLSPWCAVTSNEILL